MVATLCGIATSVALDVIAKVGSWGNFLREKHTLKNFKSMFYSDLFERVQYESWQKKGGKLIEERLREKP
jgi:trimethylamine:corrinoid methyltransferase-like protein